MNKKTEKKIAYFKELGVSFLDKMPKGWKVLQGAQNAPNGYVWVFNGKDPFKKNSEYASALLKVQ